MQVEFLGHAGICIDSGKTKVLMDGWFSREGGFDASWYQLPANHHLGDSDWSKIDALIVSHEHLDHLDSQFLRKLPTSIPLYIPSYGSSLFARKLRRMTGRSPKVLSAGKEYQIGDLQLRIWTEASPMNQDSVWVFRQGGHSIVHTVDSRLNPDQFDEILNYLGREPDLLLVQCSGASWFPLVYENYDEATKYARGMCKREQKLLYALAVANRLRPGTVVCCAGPPAFLDESLRYANADPSFPTPGEACKWFKAKGYRGRIEGPLPGDRLDLTSGELTQNRPMHDAFAWECTAPYIDEYARRMQPYIAEVYRRADSLQVGDMNEAVTSHFTRMLALNPYFNQRIDMTMCLDIEGPEGGVWLVDFRGSGSVRRGTLDDDCQYRYRFHSRWLKRILVDHIPWEDFLLSLRFSAYRDPDIYNDHLLGLLKFNDAASLRVIETYEKRETPESIVVATDEGSHYEIARYCPHAGAALDIAPIEGHILTCLNHHYRFDLDSGKCLSGNCSLRTKKLT